MSAPVRLGFVGLGSVSEKYLRLADQLRNDGVAELVIGCDVRTGNKAATDKYRFRHFTTNYREVFDHPEVDLIVILTPMQTHGSMAKAALQTGKHVLVEKPMAIHLDEAAELLELQKSSQGLLMVAPHIVLSETYKTMWQRIKGGEIGSIHLARGFYGWAGPWWGQWFYQTGGGPMFDLGVYNLTSLTGLIGSVKRVMAMTGIAIPERVVEDESIRVLSEDNAQILMDFGNSCFGVVTTGFTIQKYRTPALELYGTKGTIQMLGDDWKPNGYELWQNNIGAWHVYEETDPMWRWYDGLRHMVECIRNGTRPYNTPEHAYHVTEVMLAALESGRTGRAVDIKSTFPELRYGVENKDATAAHLMHDRTS
jgi:predicted dehydrogenase